MCQRPEIVSLRGAIISKVWLFVKITGMFAAAAALTCGLIWLIQREPRQDPNALPMVLFFVLPLVIGCVLLLSWCQVYNFKHPTREGERLGGADLP
jgi:hypothetical protein